MPIGNIFGTSQAQGDVSQGEKQALGFLQQIRGDVSPAWQTGLGIYQMLADPNKLMANFQASPDYQFRMSQGMDAVNQNKAVNGLLRSGSALKATQSFGQNLASEEFGDYFNRELGLANFGLGAEGLAAGAGEHASGIAMQGGEDQGNLDMAQGNNISNLLGTLFSSYGMGM